MDAFLALPPQPEYARVARLVLGDAALRAGVPLAHIADVRLCADEAFALAMRRHQEAGVADPVRLHFGREGAMWHAVVIDATPARVVEDLALQVIRAIPDRVSLHADDSGLSLTMAWLVDPDSGDSGRSP